MATPNSKISLKKRILILLIISVIIIAVASFFLSQEVETLKIYLNKVFNPQISNLIIIAFPFTIGYVLSFIPEIFGEYIKEIIFGKDVPEIEQKPAEPQQPIIINNILPEQTAKPKTLVSKVPQKTEPHNGKFYPSEFLPNLEYFVGRVDLLKNVEAELKTSHRVSIHDISGLGKTFSTLKYADLHQQSYDKLFFINASKESYLESMANCGELLEPSVKSAQQQLVKVNAFKNWLEENNNWLVIFDNVDIAADIKPFVPINLKGDCLFTSNFPAVKELGKEVAIHKLGEDDSKLLLFSRANSTPHQTPTFDDQTEADAFDKILFEIDGLPISLTTTGAFIAKKQISFAKYLQRLNETPEIILETEDDFGTYHKKSALKAFSIAFDENTNTNDSPQLAEAVKILYFAASFLYPDDIHDEFLHKYLLTYYKPFAETAKPVAFWQDVCEKFTAYDLFKLNSHNETFNTHRLIQKTIQTKLNDDERKTICEQVLELLLEYFPEYDYNNKEQCEKYYQHTISALENADKLFESEDSVWLYFMVARYQELLGNYQQAEITYERDLELSESVFGENADTVAIQNNLAGIYSFLGKYDEAVKLYKTVLNTYFLHLGKNSKEVAITLNNLADTYHLQGKHEEAVKLFLEAIEIDKKTIGIEHPVYATHLHNLANAYRFQNKYDEAIKLSKEALKIGEKTIGTKNPTYASYLSNLANTFFENNNHNIAVSYFLKVLDIDKNTIGIEHPDYALHLSNLASVYYSQGKYTEALPLFEEALKIRESKLPQTHHYIKEVKDDLMDCKQKLGNS